MSSWKAPKLIIGSLVIIFISLAIWFVGQKKTETKQDQLAQLAEIRRCGPATTEEGVESRLIKKWVVNDSELQAEAQSSFLRNFSALPQRALKALENKKIRFAWESLRSDLTCSPPGSGAAVGLRFSCLKSTPKHGDVVILGSEAGMGPDGVELVTNQKDIIDGRMLPLVFWGLFEQLWNTAEDRELIDGNTRSRANDFTRLKRYVSESLKIGPAEQEFYRREFGGAGIKSPAFATRSVVLLASNLYCDGETYARSERQQPEAVKRFMSTFGCALGKPWHLAEADFKSSCI
jgi:hypothetical protein